METKRSLNTIINIHLLCPRSDVSIVRYIQGQMCPHCDNSCSFDSISRPSGMSESATIEINVELMGVLQADLRSLGDVFKA